MKIRGTDYNLEVPFEVKVPEGRYTVQSSETPAVNSTLSNALLRQME